jgi:hypothetical protein
MAVIVTSAIGPEFGGFKLFYNLQKPKVIVPKELIRYEAMTLSVNFHNTSLKRRISSPH